MTYLFILPPDGVHHTNSEPRILAPCADHDFLARKVGAGDVVERDPRVQHDVLNGGQLQLHERREAGESGEGPPVLGLEGAGQHRKLHRRHDCTDRQQIVTGDKLSDWFPPKGGIYYEIVVMTTHRTSF